MDFGCRESLLHMNLALKIVPLLSLLLLAPARGEEQVYWGLETFRSLRTLAPELAEARPVSLAPAESSGITLIGDFNRDGRPDHAVLLETGEGKNLKFFLLIATRYAKRWEMLSLHHLKPKSVGTLLWDPGRKTLAIDTHKTRRVTRPSMMRWGATGYTKLSTDTSLRSARSFHSHGTPSAGLSSGEILTGSCPGTGNIGVI